MYVSKLKNVFLYVVKCICQNYKVQMFKLQSQTVQSNSKWTCALLVLGMRRLNGIRQDPIGNFNKLQVMQIKGNACARYAGQIFRMGHFKRHSFEASLAFKTPEFRKASAHDF